MIPVVARAPRAPALEWWLVLDDTGVSLTDAVPEKAIDACAGCHVREKISFPV
jgi:hypothetical protein